MTIVKVIRIVLFTVALGFLVYYGQRNWAEIADVLNEFSPLLVIVALVLVTSSLFCKALLNLQLLKTLLHTPLADSTLLHSYAESQIVKYLPGRIWGVLFQASSLQQNIRKADVWIVSIFQVLAINASSLVVLMVTALFIDSLGRLFQVVIVAGGLLLFVFLYFNTGRLFRLLKIDETTYRKYAGLVDGKLVTRGLLIIALDWILYLGMWLALAHEKLSVLDTLITAVSYTTASIVGWLIFVLPNGLIAREAAFITFGQTVGTDMALLVVYSILVRLLFVAGDLLLYLLITVFEKTYGRSKRALGADR